MANKEHLALLKRGAVTWIEWRNLHPNIEPDLSEANLAEANLRGANLGRSNLFKIDLFKSPYCF